MMKLLNIVRSKPDDTVKRFLEAFSGGKQDKVVTLYAGDVDWSALVDDIFSHDRIICWW
uniref:Uncharacterized protein n=1 Tax=Candidatus Desulfatibia profunda TaxID=2841695 RepID=A0A8J6THV1_9BACT|nr:hypothetical protein [Candidatus Desulfatibia profunda]